MPREIFELKAGEPDIEVVDLFSEDEEEAEVLKPKNPQYLDHGFKTSAPSFSTCSIKRKKMKKEHGRSYWLVEKSSTDKPLFRCVDNGWLWIGASNIKRAFQEWGPVFKQDTAAGKWGKGKGGQQHVRSPPVLGQQGTIFKTPMDEMFTVDPEYRPFQFLPHLVSSGWKSEDVLNAVSSLEFKDLQGIGVVVNVGTNDLTRGVSDAKHMTHDEREKHLKWVVANLNSNLTKICHHLAMKCKSPVKILCVTPVALDNHPPGLWNKVRNHIFNSIHYKIPGVIAVDTYTAFRKFVWVGPRKRCATIDASLLRMKYDAMEGRREKPDLIHWSRKGQERVLEKVNAANPKSFFAKQDTPEQQKNRKALRKDVISMTGQEKWVWTQEEIMEY